LYQVRLDFNEPMNASENDNPIEAKGWLFFVQDRDMAERLLRAFTHAAELCGAKQEAF
jgi:hypothetical protein